MRSSSFLKGESKVLFEDGDRDESDSSCYSCKRIRDEDDKDIKRLNYWMEHFRNFKRETMFFRKKLFDDIPKSSHYKHESYKKFYKC